MIKSDQERTGVPVPFSAGTRLPVLEAPAGACDCHMHIYDSRYPTAPGATLFPPDASVAQYRMLQQRLGTDRTVVVTPSTYGTDNRCTLDALAVLGSHARGVAVVDGSVTDRELERLARAGIRGIRFNLARGGTSDAIDALEILAHRVHELGWHVQLLMPPDQLSSLSQVIRRLPAQIVFDHLGRLSGIDDLSHPACQLIRELLDKNRAWVKLSGAYLLSRDGPPDYADASVVGKAWVDMAPERLIWGSDWPHVVASAGEKPMPDDADLLDLLLAWVPDEDTRNNILVDNPARLYGF
jgi:predicted TIM-barrel fold metal-dependent hydrolase